MSNNLQVLKVLKQSAIEKKEELDNSIKEMHEQSLKELNEDFKNTMNKKLNSIEKNINLTMQDMKEQNEMRYSFKHLIIAIVTTAFIFFPVGIILADYTPKNSEKEAWIVPKEMRYTHKDGRYIKSREVEHNKNKTITYIKIGE